MSKSRPITAAEPEDPFGVGAEPGEAPADHLADADREPDRAEVGVGDPAAVVLG